VTDGTLQLLRQLIRQEMRALRTTEIAVVQDQHPAEQDNYACTVRLRDTGIVLSKVPVATGRLGTVAIPPVGAMVLVQFIGGDINAPVVVNSLYSDEERSPPSVDGELAWNLPHDSSADDAITLTIKTVGDKSAKFALGSAVTIELQEADPVVTIDVGGNASIKIDSDGTVSIESARTLKVKANEISMAADGNMKIEAGGKLDLKGSVVNLN
jgi:uncharacterized protein involved in type VI secretion and phage assembly